MWPVAMALTWLPVGGDLGTASRQICILDEQHAQWRLWDVDHRQVPAELKAVLGACLQEPELHSACVGPQNADRP